MDKSIFSANVIIYNKSTGQSVFELNHSYYGVLYVDGGDTIYKYDFVSTIQKSQQL